MVRVDVNYVAFDGFRPSQRTNLIADCYQLVSYVLFLNPRLPEFPDC
jgi:hypothetical protein